MPDLTQYSEVPGASSPTYEEDCEALANQFDAAEAVLKVILVKTEVIRGAVRRQKYHVDKTTQDVEAIVKCEKEKKKPQVG
jgi:hypothetical protein